MEKLKLKQIPGNFTIYRFPPEADVPAALSHSSFYSLSKTSEELSIVAEHQDLSIHQTSVKLEKDWACLKVEGVLDFSLTGILASIATPLATNEISLFAISTFDTDYILVKRANLGRTAEVLRNSHFQVDTL